MLDNIVHLVYNTHMNDFELQLKEALKKNLRVEVELVDVYGYYENEHSQHNTTRVYFGDDLIFSTDYSENQEIRGEDDEWEDENEDENEDNWND